MCFYLLLFTINLFYLKLLFVFLFLFFFVFHLNFYINLNLNVTETCFQLFLPKPFIFFFSLKVNFYLFYLFGLKNLFIFFLQPTLFVCRFFFIFYKFFSTRFNYFQHLRFFIIYLMFLLVKQNCTHFFVVVNFFVQSAKSFLKKIVFHWLVIFVNSCFLC